MSYWITVNLVAWICCAEKFAGIGHFIYAGSSQGVSLFITQFTLIRTHLETSIHISRLRDLTYTEHLHMMLEAMQQKSIHISRRRTIHRSFAYDARGYTPKSFPFYQVNFAISNKFDETKVFV